MSTVYHGSFMEIRKPDISFSRQTLDFGRGFYITPLREQAVRWALRWQRRGKNAIVNTYVFDDIIRGGVANDKVFNTLELFFDGLISEEEALGRLKFEKPNHQICICRQDLMDRLLVFQSSEEVSDGSQ